MAEVTNVKVVRFSSKSNEAYGEDLYAHDYGQIIRFEGIELPEAYEVHFGDTKNGEGTARIGNETGVAVPSVYLEGQGTLYAWVFLHDTETSGTTKKLGIFSVKAKAWVPDAQPSQEEGDVISDTIIELNKAVTKTAEDVVSANAAKEAAQTAQAAAEAAQLAAETAQEHAEEESAYAQEMADNAAASEENAGRSESNAAISANNALISERNAANSATNAEVSAQDALESANDSDAAKIAAQAAKDAADTAQAGAESAQRNAAESASAASTAKTGAETAARNANTSAENAAGSASAASTAKTGAESARDESVTAKNDAKGFANTARNWTDGKNLDGTDSTSHIGNNAEHYADAAAQSATDANAAKQAIEDMTVSSETLTPGSPATVQKTVDPQTGVVNLNFGIPAGADGEDADVSALAPVIKASAGPASILTITDGAEDRAMDSLVVGIEPVQDLHGFNHPWPGGGGTNKRNLETIVDVFNTTYGLTASLDGEYLRIRGTYTGSNNTASFRALYFKPSADLSNVSVKGFLISGANIFYMARYAETERESLAIDLNSLVPNTEYDIKIGLMFYEGGTAPTSWTPYENICPIAGWTRTKVWDDPVYAGTIRFNQIFPLKTGTYTGTNFTASFDGMGCLTINVTATASATTANNMTSLGAGTWIVNHIYAFLGESNGIQLRLKGWGISTDAVFRTGTPIYNNIAITFTDLAVGTYSVYPMIFDLTEMFGETKAEEILAMGSAAGAAYVKSLFRNDYYPYDATGIETCISAANGDPYRHVEIEFPTSAGTVYGGKLNVVTGEMVVDRAMVDLGDLDYSVSSPTIHVFRSDSLRGVIKPPASLWTVPLDICDMYSAKAWFPITSSDNGYFSVADAESSSSNGRVVFVNHNFDSIEGFANGMSGHIMVFYLATPTTYRLTPTEVKTLLGTNNIWADTGDVLSAEYSADTKGYVDGKTGVTDVQVNGVSIQDAHGVANVPIASSSALGVVKTNTNFGTNANSNTGELFITPSVASEHKTGTGAYRPIVPKYLHSAVYYGLAKAAGADMASVSNPTIGVYPEAQKSAISEMLNGSVSVEGTTPTINALPGVRYVCGEVSTLTITPPASGCIDVMFTSGSTATVLTINGTVKWANGFDPTSLDADTTYEINICDGLGVACAWT